MISRLGLIATHASPLAALGTGHNGGLNTYVLEVMRALAGLGVEVHTFTQAPESGVKEVAKGAYVHEIAVPSRAAETEDLVASVAEFAQAIQALDLGIEAWWSHYWIGGLAAMHLRQVARAPWAHSAHTLEKVKHLGWATPELAERMEAEIAISQQADLLVANTPVEQQQLVEFYGAKEDKVRVALPGVSEEWKKNWRLRQNGGPARLLYVGRLEPLKGPDIALQAFASSGLAKQGGRLSMVGGASKSYRQELAQLVRKLKIKKAVEFKGALESKSEMLAVYAQADCLLATSRSESFGLAAVEAQACGCPVVASNVGGLPYAVADGDSGLLVETGDVAGFAAALNSLWSTPGLLERLSLGAKTQASRFNWEACVSGVLAGLSEI